MTRKLIVKKEIRTLGLDLCNPHRLVGAIVRGGSYIDGVEMFPAKPILDSKSIGSAIVETRFFPELRLIMTHDPETRLDTRRVERLTQLPVIQISSARTTNPNGFKPYKVGRKRLQVKSSVPPRTLQEILSTTWTTGTLPEPLRIAHLLSKSRIPEKKARFQANK